MTFRYLTLQHDISNFTVHVLSERLHLNQRRPQGTDAASHTTVTGRKTPHIADRHTTASNVHVPRSKSRADAPSSKVSTSHTSLCSLTLHTNLATACARLLIDRFEADDSDSLDRE